MEKDMFRIVTIGGVAGAVAAVVVGFGANALGVFPAATDSRIHAYLIRHPAIVYEMVSRAQADEAAQAQSNQQKAIEKLGLKALFDPAIAYVTGPVNAKNTFVEFFDYNCVHCRNAFPAVKAFYEAHKNDTRFAFIEFPINGEASTMAATAAVAARAQGAKYLALHFALMGEKSAIDSALLFEDARKVGLDVNALTKAVADPAVTKALTGGRKLASEIGVSGTPTFVLNGKAIEGEITAADFKRLVK